MNVEKLAQSLFRKVWVQRIFFPHVLEYIPDKKEKSVAGGYRSPECDLVFATYTQSHSFNFSAEQKGTISSGQGFSGFLLL